MDFARRFRAFTEESHWGPRPVRGRSGPLLFYARTGHDITAEMRYNEPMRFLRFSARFRSGAAWSGAVLRIIVVSDTHGRTDVLDTIVRRHRKADWFIHLGDHDADADAVAELIPGRLLRVCGNCDFGSEYPAEAVAELAGKRIFYTHGNDYYVKYDEERIVCEAKDRHADILLYGHTHVPVSRYVDGLYILNPGSAGAPREGPPTYGIVDITPAGIVTNLASV